MWCLPVGNPWRQHHQCASSTKAAPSLLPSTTTASSRWKAQAVYRLYTGVNSQIPIPTRQRRCPDHWSAGRRCQLPRPKGEGSASSQGDRRCGRRCGRRPPRPLRPPRTGGERNPKDSKHDDCAWTWVPSVKTVAGADSRISAGPAGRVQLEKNLWVQEYTGISGYIVPQTLHIEW
jgi:hypothetical protein